MKELTQREKEVLKRVILGKTNETIAKELFLSVNTVKIHVKSICTKFNVKNRIQAAVFAIKNFSIFS